MKINKNNKVKPKRHLQKLSSGNNNKEKSKPQEHLIGYIYNYKNENKFNNNNANSKATIEKLKQQQQQQQQKQQQFLPITANLHVQTPTALVANMKGIIKRKDINFWQTFIDSS